MQYIVFPALLLLMYALVLRPQQQRIREQQKVVASLEVGDDVLSSAGIYGCIKALDDEVAVLEVAPGVEIRVARGAIARRTVEQTEAEQGPGVASDPAPQSPPQDQPMVEED